MSDTERLDAQLSSIARNARLKQARDPIEDPQAGDKVEDWDGATMYVVGRRGARVRITMRPPGDSQAQPKWIFVSTFQRRAAR